MTTPADELKTAAATLRKLVGQTTSPPWSTNWNAQEYELVAPSRPYPIAEWTYAIATQGPKVAEQRAECDTADADYIAVMGPNVGALLADWLGSWGDVDIDEHASMPDDLRHALRIARAVNAATHTTRS